MKYLKIALILSALAVFFAACNQTPNVNNSAVNSTPNIQNAANNGNTTANSAPETKELEMASGRDIYMEVCANCHKEDGSGGKVTIDGKTLKAENLTTPHAKKESDEEYVEYIKNGVPDEGMPAFKDKLSDAEIKSVIAFIRKELQGK